MTHPDGPGFTVADGALMLDLSPMKQVTVDPATASPWPRPG
jgi:hypothetical protein